MKIDRREQDGVTIIKLQGVIKLGESSQFFSTYLEKILDERVSSLLLDMSEIDYVDSTGLGELVGYLQRFSDIGGKIALLRPQERILKLLKLTRLDEVFEIFQDEAEGIAAVRTAKN